MIRCKEDKVRHIVKLGDPEQAVHWLYTILSEFCKRSDVPADVIRQADTAMFSMHMARRCLDDHKAGKREAA